MPETDLRETVLQERFVEALKEPFAQATPRRRSVRFLLGSDEAIRHERRTAFAPRHLERLRVDLEGLGLEPELFFVTGTGARTDPAYPDAAYQAAGARAVSVDEAAALDAVDLVHALKEPTAYEATLAGPFVRLGALHLASRPPGVCAMLRRGRVTAILDGATVGDCSYRLTGGDRTPIVGSMSRFAGAVAGRKVAEALDLRGLGPGPIVVVGAGIAGRAAIRKVAAHAVPLRVVEPWRPSRERLTSLLPALGIEHFKIVEAVSDELFDDAVGLVFAHRSGARAAEKVCRLEQIERMRDGAAIADIAIDQGGSIAHDGYDMNDDAETARGKYIQLLGGRFSYYAEVNMPREEPREASDLHGDSSLPYVTVFLVLCALHDGPAAAIDALLERPRRVLSDDDPPPSDLLEAVLQDLRNGVQIVLREDAMEITDPDVAADAALSGWVRSCTE
ncbi:MAG: hypothetical protein AAGC60_08880 [Acidobacteriota bacterium]